MRLTEGQALLDEVVGDVGGGQERVAGRRHARLVERDLLEKPVHDRQQLVETVDGVEEVALVLAQVPLEDLRTLSPAFDDGYYALHEPAAQLARKRSRGGSAPARVCEQLERARAALAAHTCC